MRERRWSYVGYYGASADAKEVNMGKMMLLGIGGIVAILATLKIAGALLGAVLGIIAFLLFKALPIILIGWIVVRAWRYLTARTAG